MPSRVFCIRSALDPISGEHPHRLPILYESRYRALQVASGGGRDRAMTIEHRFPAGQAIIGKCDDIGTIVDGVDDGGGGVLFRR